jgi:hypothetical protein
MGRQNYAQALPFSNYFLMTTVSIKWTRRQFPGISPVGGSFGFARCWAGLAASTNTTIPPPHPLQFSGRLLGSRP